MECDESIAHRGPWQPPTCIQPGSGRWLNKSKRDRTETTILELADTLLPDGIEQCARAGVTQIVIMPYFLNSGRHVTEDIPAVMASVRPHYPDIDIMITGHVGASGFMADSSCRRLRVNRA